MLDKLECLFSRYSVSDDSDESKNFPVCSWNQPLENFVILFATAETESLEKSTLVILRILPLSRISKGTDRCISNLLNENSQTQNPGLWPHDTYK